MQKAVIKTLVEQAARDSNIANVFMKYNENYYNLIPLKASDQLFLAINEDDFIFDGFRVSRFRDVTSLHIKNDKCNEIIKKEGLFQSLTIPEIELDNWESVFISLQTIGKNIIVQYETPEGTEDNFTIGKIDRVYKSCLYIYHFDADGIWEREPYRIPFQEVTSVTFESRYISVFTKHIPDAPKK